MANMPPDIWLYVADFIPDKVIYQLRCVNSVFLELAINIRWKEVTISTKQIYEAKKILDRISDPYISVRVRALTIHLATWEPAQNGLVLAPSTQHNIDYARRETTRKYNPTSTKLGLRSSDPSNSIMNSLLNTCAGLTSLRKLTLDFSSISPVSSPQLGFGLFTRSLWPLVRKKLRHLFLKGTAQGYCTVLASRPTFPNLKELGMDLTADPKLISDCENSKAPALIDTLVPFLGKVNSRLEALRIKSQPCHSIPTDLSQLFIQMPFFPYLRTLEIRMPFNQNLLDSSGLKNLLSKSSHNLETVCLRLNPAGFSLPWALEGQLIAWLSDCLTEPQTLSCIQVLDIYPTGGNCDIVLGYIRRASKHLRSIVIRDRYFEADEVDLIIDAASHCPNLISLHLNIWELDINLFDQLYMKLPRLESLRLSTVDSFVDGYPRVFVNKLGDRCYNGWKLADISLCYGEREVDSRTMRALARSIPSVRSFFGRGHMRFEHH